MYRPREVMEGAFVDEAVARPEVERLAGHQSGERASGPGASST
jgi:hypothetical protein